MSLPLVVGPGPLEGGPKKSPGSAKGGKDFSACLTERMYSGGSHRDPVEPDARPPCGEEKRGSDKKLSPKGTACARRTRKEAAGSPSPPESSKIQRDPRKKESGAVSPLQVSPEVSQESSRSGTSDLSPVAETSAQVLGSVKGDSVEGCDASSENQDVSFSGEEESKESQLLVFSPVVLASPLAETDPEGSVPEVEGEDDSSSKDSSPLSSSFREAAAVGVIPFLPPDIKPDVSLPPVDVGGEEENRVMGEVLVALEKSFIPSTGFVLGTEGGPVAPVISESLFSERPPQSSPGKPVDAEKTPLTGDSPLVVPKDFDLPPQAPPSVVDSPLGEVVPVRQSFVTGSDKKESSDTFPKPDKNLRGEETKKLAFKETVTSLSSGVTVSDVPAEFKKVLTHVVSPPPEAQPAVVLPGRGESVHPPVEPSAPAAPARPVAPPVLTPNPVDLAREIHVHLQAGQSTVRIDLDPRHLGPLRIALETKGKDVSMNFVVDNDGARQVLVSHIQELSGSLSTLGWTVNGMAVNVASGGVGNHRGQGGPLWDEKKNNTSPVPLQKEPSTDRRVAGPWRVDVVA